MQDSFNKLLSGYKNFRTKYASGDNSVMQSLAYLGQKPTTMVVSCCDSRVDPALLLQCDPGDLFVTRNVANIVPPFERDEHHHGTSAALEFGICYLKVKHLVILGHSQCGGINALIDDTPLQQDDFISKWVSILPKPEHAVQDEDHYAQRALINSYVNCLTFPWIKEKIDNGSLLIHLWFFNIKKAELSYYDPAENQFKLL
jgi:carbonic anhydrase